MNFLDVYANLIRGIFLILIVYYSFKHDFKKLTSAVLVFVLTYLLLLLDKTLKIKIDFVGSILYFSVIVMSVFLGSSLKFYDKYSWWDRMLHFICGIMFVSFGIPVANAMEIANKFGILFFSLTFSTTLHVLWEIAEYTVDHFAHTDHQRWQKHYQSHNHLSKNAIQPAGLVDTMNDIIICMLGTIAACMVWWFVLRT